MIHIIYLGVGIIGFLMTTYLCIGAFYHIYRIEKHLKEGKPLADYFKDD